MGNSKKGLTSNERVDLAILSQEPRATSELSRPSRRSAPSAWRRTGGWLLPVLAAAIIFAPPFAPTAEAQTTLVSNVGQTRSGSLVRNTHEGAQAFTTGDNSAGYIVTSVGLDMSSGADPTINFTVGIWTNSNSNLPGSSLVTLMQPASLILGVNEFTTSGIELVANTTYWVVVDSTGGGSVQWEATASDSEDSTASGWSIADESYERPYDGDTWSSYTDPLKFRVNGTAIGIITNNAPVFTEGTSTTRSVAENTASGQNIGTPVTATDADTSDTLTYTLGGTDASSFAIVSASGQLQTSAALDYETQASYAVTVSVSDATGGADSINVTINVTADRAALVALYNATDGANWTNNTNWLSNEALSEWFGVSTDVNGRVTRLYLHLNGLNGAIPEELGGLASLQELFLFRNGLSGEIPEELGNLTSLTRLHLHENELSGEIPEELGNLTSLQELTLHQNELSGEIPVVLGNLTSLTRLDLSQNMLSGEIPVVLGNLTSFQELSLWGNELSGEIPVVLGNLTSLYFLALSQNMLSGEIPVELGNLTSLQELYLWGNELSGEIPVVLGNLTSLYFLALSQNMLSGEIPVELGNLTSLQELSLWGNELSGEIPTELGSLTSLKRLYLAQNMLSGAIPAELGNLTSLQELSLWGNELSGEIPTELGSLTSLKRLYLAQNMLSGAIPAELGNLTNLEILSLWGNELSGKIPAVLGNLPSLQELSLDQNGLSGAIPVELGNLANLQLLYLNQNGLSGAIPVELGNLSNLQVLYLDQNELSGTIPAELGVLANLQKLYLHSNELTGEIPSWLVNLTALRELSLWSNQLTGTIPPEVAPAQDRAALLVLYNATDGANWTDSTNWRSNEPLSEWHGVSTDEQGRVDELRLSANGLTGTIGAELGALTNLQELKLNGNTDLTGPLPLGLMNLDDLTTVWIQDTGLCAPEDVAFRAWAASIGDFKGCGAPPPPPPPFRPRPPPPPPASDYPTADAGPDQLGVWEGALVTLDGSGSSDPDDDPLRYRWNQLSGEPVVLSSQNVVNPTFTAPEGLTVDAVLRFSLLVTDPSGRFDSDTVTVTVDPEAEPPPAEDWTYYFPHLAVGAGWQTTITYINYSPQEVNCQTDFLSDQGTPLMVSFADQGTVVSRTDVLPPEGSVHQETNVELSAPPALGWARATCSGPVKASLLFRLHNSEGVPIAEAGVNAAAVPATRFVTFAEQGEGKFGTGVAYANPSVTAALVTFTARDADGLTLASVTQELPAGGHGAQNMAPLFGLSSFTGLLEVTSSEPIVTLSLNFEADPVFSSLPPGEVDAAAQGSTTYYFPHLAVGARWQTTITYINYSPQEVTCQTEFLSDHGSPLMVSFAGRGTVVSRTDVLPPGGSVHQETNVELRAPLAPGWARATCSGPVKASLLFRLHNSEGVPVAEAAVNAAAVPATRFVTFAEQGEGKFGTGVAYANPSDTTTAFVTFTVRDAAGNELARSAPLTLLPRGHGAENMPPLFGLPSFTGSLEVTATAPIVSLSLNNEADPVFSSLPPGELDAAAQ